MVSLKESDKELVLKLLKDGYDHQYIAQMTGLTIHQVTDFAISLEKTMIVLADDSTRQLARIRQYSLVHALDVQMAGIHEQLKRQESDLEDMKMASDRDRQNQEELIIKTRQQLLNLMERKAAIAAQDGVFFNLLKDES